MTLGVEDLGKVKVYSASRHEEEARTAPSSVTIITAEEIRSYGWRTLGDVMRSVRGFYTSYDRNYTYLGVRGFLRPGDENTRILLLLNGQRMNDNVYDTADFGTELPLDLDLIDHIEVVRGPGSSLFGTNAVFGVINVITRRAATHPEVDVAGDVGSYLSRTGRVEASATRGQISGLISASLYESAGSATLFFPEFAGTNGGFADNIDGDRYARLFTDMQDGSFRVSALYGGRRKIVPTASYATNFNDPGTRTTDTYGYLDTAYQRSLTAQTDIDVRAFYHHYSYYGTYAYGGTDSPGRILNYDTAVSDWTGMDASLAHAIGRHRLTVGADYEYSFRVDQKNYNPGQAPFLDDHRAPWLAAAYGEGEFKLPHDLVLHAGGRLDYFDDNGAALSPRAAVVYSPTPRTTLKYVFGRAFRAPNAFENYYSDGVTQERPLKPLQKENIRSHEMVFDHGFSSWLSLTLDAYYNNLDHLIDWETDPSNEMTYAENIGQVRGRGLEFELDAKRPSGWEGRASYGLADAYDEINKQRLDNSPLHQGKLNAIIPLTRRGSLGVESFYTSAQQSYQSTRVSPFFLTNLTVSTKPIWGGWEFSGSCYNAFDRRWFNPAGPNLVQSAIEQDGRTLRFKISYRLVRERATP